MSRAARRAVVKFFRAEHQLSERKACELARYSRSTYRRPSLRTKRDEKLLERLLALAAERPRFGYRRLHVMLGRVFEKGRCGVSARNVGDESPTAVARAGRRTPTLPTWNEPLVPIHEDRPDVPKAVIAVCSRSLRRGVRIFWDAVLGWLEHDNATQSAALAFYTVFSLLPLLLIALGIAGFVLDEESVRLGALDGLERFVGPDAMAPLSQALDSVSGAAPGTIFGSIGVIVLLVGATSIFAQLQTALNGIFGGKHRSEGALRLFMRRRLDSFLAMLGFGVLFLLPTVGGLILAGMDLSVPGAPGVVAGTDLLFAAVCVAALFRVLPDVRVPWRYVWIGGLITAVLLAVGKYAVAEYLQRLSGSSVLGAAGTPVAVLLWVYYSSMIVLFGAEVTRVLSTSGTGTRAVETTESTREE